MFALHVEVELSVRVPVPVALHVAVPVEEGVSVFCVPVAVADAVTVRADCEPVPVLLDEAVPVGTPEAEAALLWLAVERAVAVATVVRVAVAALDAVVLAESVRRVPEDVEEVLAVAVAVRDGGPEPLAAGDAVGVARGVTVPQPPVPLAVMELDGVAEAHREGEADVVEAFVAHCVAVTDGVAQLVPAVEALACALLDTRALGESRELTDTDLLAAGDRELEALAALEVEAAAEADAEPVAVSV